MIEIKNLYLSFTKEYYALKNINLDVADGEKVALIGETDSGKTMLLRVLAKLEKYKSGEIYIKNINIKKINFKQDIQVGFVPRSFVFLENKTLK
ncbi:MAG: ATP-binding cassette domain-containing protein, partial [Clostridia bacterium]|nr:ATP-binding cassette domain-containing protein [Clostridia bacterium]